MYADTVKNSPSCDEAETPIRPKLPAAMSAPRVFFSPSKQRIDLLDDQVQQHPNNHRRSPTLFSQSGSSKCAKIASDGFVSRVSMEFYAVQEFIHR
ncbi:hypothetical protein SRHO_G00127530 [Serrasalmus rhombeus]